ncbi:CoA-binding domain protein [Natronococcus amylolyticus DSM 10524]|uniref:CoA-binding domain protein n=1 Tax=Natronococcus amylolyticus DSM 10524 TaxID=1227497 RepID=L9X7A8_9EURY|nr:CoA-binding protein [Natronococcus amylolyticus]ELY57331.1 CoA-binding domain protein [Natronococcus amylolyticus DSM 10524]
MPVSESDRIREALESETIAVVGCSSTPGKAAHDVPRYLLEQGYDVLPVNPNAEEIFDRSAADALSDVDREIDVVCVFRPSEEVAGIVEEVLERDDVETVWTQLGIRDDEAAERVEESGRAVVQDQCLKVQHQRHLA